MIARLCVNGFTSAAARRCFLSSILAYSPTPTARTKTMHLPLSIRQLANALHGTVRLGQLPPLDGLATNAERVVFTPYAAQPGTLFWDLSTFPSASMYFPEEAFLRGATGIISPRRIEPWAGRYSIQVTDLARAEKVAYQLAHYQLFHSAASASALQASR